MCGIAGFTRFQHSVGDADTLKAMGNVIRHRGLDASGEYIDDNVGICHRRLSIIDLSDAGTQPMHYQDDMLVIVFNGEIYNFACLRENLLKEGFKFTTRTDTEVLLALYQRDKEKMLDKIEGMFAFAIWDKQDQSLFLARDRLGKKPLYYYNGNGHFIFGSEIKSILATNQVPRVINDEAVYDFFAYQYIPDPKSIFKDIYKLEPGHYMRVSAEKTTKTCYWDISFKPKSTKNASTIANELLLKIKKSTISRMVSDVPLGAFLSGGVDSSGVVGLMAENSTSPVTTCAIGFDSKKYDEVVFAKKVAEQFKTTHHEFTVRENVSEHLEKIVGYFDEPFADPSLVPTYFVSALARKKVTLSLIHI